MMERIDFFQEEFNMSKYFYLTIAFLLIFVFTTLIGGCARVNREDREFTELSGKFIEDYLKLHPVRATQIGEHRYDSRLDDMSQEAVDNELTLLKGYLDRLNGIKSEKLSVDNRVDYVILKNEIEREIFSLEELQGWKNNPLLYTQLIGNSVYLLLAREFATKEERLNSAIGRLREFPRLVDQAMANLSNPPRIHTETAIKQNRGNISLLDRELREFARGIGKVDEVFERELDVAIDALKRFQDYLEKELYFRSNGDFRLGKELFSKKLSLTLQSDMTYGEIIERARAEVRRLHDEMYKLALPLYMKTHPDEKVKMVTTEEKKRIVKAVLDERDLITLPDEPLAIIWAPEFSRGVAVAGLRSPGPLDKGMKSFYVVSPVPQDWSKERVESYLREYNNQMIRILTIHEAMPGHYVQLAYANRCPSLVRAIFSSGTFVEGWAVYTERMMLEEGFRNQDPKLWLQRKKFYLRAVINSLLDAGIHAERMSQYEAMKLMIEDGFQEESEAAGKWIRACLTSTQLSTYFVGYNEILAIREEAREKWGTEFRLKRFHEKLLSHGSPPPKFVRELIFQ